jgi:uncharacterized protein
VTALQRFPLLSFFALAYTWTWLCWWTAFGVGRAHFAFESLATLGQFGPFFAAVVITWATGGRAGLRSFFGRFKRWRAHPVWVVVALLLLPAIMLAAIWIYAAATGTISWLQFRDTWSTLPAHFVVTLLFNGPLGEEPGWRGFALPRLQARYGLITANISLGILHAAWHVPLWWTHPGTTPLAIYVVGVVAMTVLFTWLFNHTGGSVFYALLFHASLNTAGTRLPDVPAHYSWVACLWAVVLVILVCDRRLGQATDKPACMPLSPVRPAAGETMHA